MHINTRGLRFGSGDIQAAGCTSCEGSKGFISESLCADSPFTVEAGATRPPLSLTCTPNTAHGYTPTDMPASFSRNHTSFGSTQTESTLGQQHNTLNNETHCNALRHIFI